MPMTAPAMRLAFVAFLAACATVNAAPLVKPDNSDALEVADYNTPEDFEARDVIAAHNDRERRIAGGFAVTNEPQWMAKITVYTAVNQVSNSYSGCGGTLISPNYVLTASHCLYNDLTNAPYPDSWLSGSGYSMPRVIVQIGGYKDDIKMSGSPVNGYKSGEFDKAVPGQRNNVFSLRYATGWTCHPNYVHRLSGNTNYNHDDVCLLRLDSAVTTRQTVALSTWTDDSEHFTGQSVVAYGYGGTGSATFSDTLLQASLPIVSDATCSLTWSTTNKFCTSSMNADVCGGDSGGPLMSPGGTYQIAVNSYGSGCRTGLAPTVAIQVAPYRQWIDSIVGAGNVYWKTA